ncbi:hypothetical protein KSP39_PZI006577 [Platanthera zijinensis]|uniref:Uncharacterized protein n=1 Tax=Platanthera zijinensis TaxID=2320716 RepID=A0AAP0BRH3_9ASPA
MVWSHPGISIEDLVDRIKGFVDILVLASGYQSSGLPAIWDVGSIKKALKWGIFFEDVLKSLRRSYGNYEESVKELDAALSHLTSDPNFPLGLKDMSSATLSNARRLVLEHFLHAHPLKDTHLAAFLRAVVEIDIDELSESHTDSSSAYIGRLDLQMESLDLAAKKLLPKNAAANFNCLKHVDQDFHSPLESDGGNNEFICADNSFFVVKQVLHRQAIIADIHSMERGLHGLSDSITRNNLMGSADVSSE